MVTEADFQRQLDTNPADWRIRLLFAAWLDEDGDPRGPGYRALASLWRHPLKANHNGVEAWAWACSPSDMDAEAFPHFLWGDWFSMLPAGEGNERFWPLWAEDRGAKTRVECEDAAALAFAKLPAGRQAALLKSPAPDVQLSVLAGHPATGKTGKSVALAVNNEKDFRNAIESEPDNWAARLAFAEWLGARASGYRALALLQRSPALFEKEDRRWVWLNAYLARDYSPRGDEITRALLPYDWYDQLPKARPTPRSYAIERASLSESLDDAAFAFARLPPERQAELLSRQLARE